VYIHRYLVLATLHASSFRGWWWLIKSLSCGAKHCESHVGRRVYVEVVALSVSSGGFFFTRSTGIPMLSRSPFLFMNLALRRARGGPRFGRGLLLVRPYPQRCYLIPSKATSFSFPSSSGLSPTHRFLFAVSPSSSSSSSSSSLSSFSPERLSAALRLQSQLQKTNPTHITLHHPTTPQPHQRPLLRTTLIGSSRRTFCSTPASQLSNQVAMAGGWSAERVRDTFIGYFKENGHTFG